ncbi:MAG: sensor histidine kinase, partial [Lysobacteraceae bacterium]
MRYDDSLETVLSADMSSPMGAQLAWRQLVDLVGRGRVAASGEVIAQLRTLRAMV